MSDLIVDSSRPRLRIPESELRLSFARSGGPGGQNVNKVETKVEVRWNPLGSVFLSALSDSERTWFIGRIIPRLTSDGELLLTSSRTRAQAQNRADALAKLAETVRTALARPKRRHKTRVPRGVTERRLQQKKRDSRVKKDRNWRDD